MKQQTTRCLSCLLAFLFFYFTSGLKAQNNRVAQMNNSASVFNAGGTSAGEASSQEMTYTPKWDVKPFDHKVFVENKGQFTNETGRTDDKILYEAKLGRIKAYFLPGGLVYRYEGWFEKSEAEREKEELERAKERDKGHVEELTVKFQRAVWVGANPEAEVIAEEVLAYPYLYGVGKDATISANVYRRITYKNLYPGIDIEYVFPEEEKEGIKYNIILHPGANLSLVKLKYPGAQQIIKNKEGDVVVKTEMNDFTDHAPVSYYENGEKINIQYRINGNEESFQFYEPYDNTKKIIIDPWTTNPAFTGSYNQAYDIDYDNSGNVLVYGGWSPAQLVKLNSAGAIQWKYNANTINTDPDAQWGDFCVDKVTGRSYIIEGFNPTPTGARSLKISAAGALVGTFAGNANFEEMDRVAYNECTRRLVIAGGGTNAQNQGCILDTNMTGFTPQNVLGANLPFHDMWLLAMDPTGTTCYMGSTESCCNPSTAYDNRLLKLNVPALTAGGFNFNSRTAFGTWMPEGVSNVLYMTWSGVPANGYNGLTCSKNFLYFYDGVDLRKLNKSTGAQIVNRANVGNTMQSYGGIDVDVCDNVYVGRNNSRIFVFNGNTLAAGSAPTSTLVCTGTVYDLVLGKNYNEVYACGNGFVQAFTISSPPITFTNTITNPNCGSCNGSITANLYECGVSTAATYSWSDGQTTQTAANLCAGTYTVTITPTTECRSYTSVITLTASGALTPTITAVPGTLCNGQSTVLTASGGTTYTWSANAGGATTNTVSVSPGGTTTYTVSSTTGSCNGTQTISVTVNPAPTLTLAANSYTICNGSNTGLSASGATTYTWTTSTGLSNPNSATPTASPTTTTVYTVTGTSLGCNSTPVTATVNVNPIPTLTTSATSNTVCATGSATLTVNGASTYTWSPAGSLNNANSSTPIATPTTTTTYTVTGTSAAGCNGNSTITVTVNPLPTLTVTPSSVTVCPTGSATLTASGASTYTWSPASTLNTPNGSTVVATPTASTTYTVNGTNAAGCSNTNTVNVSVNPSLNVTVNSPTTCAGVGVVLSASGASTYSWSPPGGLSSTSGATVTATGTVSTSYTVTGTSAGCVGTNTSVVTINPLPTLTVNATASAICSGNSTTLTVNGASTYTWSPAGSLSSSNGSPVVATPTTMTTYTVTGTNSNGCVNATQIFIDVSPTPTMSAAPATICSGQSTVLTASGASTFTWSANAGSVNTSTASVNPGSTTAYTITGTVGSCTSSVTTTVTVNATPTLTMTSNSYTICNGNSTGISAGGATTYTWTTGTGLSCTVCPTPTANPSGTTVYTVSGTTGSCVSAPATVTVNVNALPNITATPNSSSICSSTSATITANGGTTYTWSPSGSLSSGTGSPVTATPTASTTYTINGTDANGCQNTNTVSITVAPTPTMNINAVPGAVCAGQSVILNGGTATTYTWSSNAGSANTSTVSVTPSATDTYTLTGTIGSCTASATVTVPVNPLPVIGASTITAAPCGQSTGCVDTVLVSGGTPTYTYSWNGGPGSTAAQYCNQPAGTYVLVVTDANGCQATQNISIPNINGPSAPNVAASSTVVCTGDSVTLAITSPQAGTTYTWTDISGTSTGTTYTVQNISPSGSYNISITATDINGCVSAATNVTINVNSLPPTLVSGTTHFCKNDNTVLNASPSGAGYTYQWSQNGTPISGATSSSYTATSAGLYNVTITDNATGCQADGVANYTVTVDSLPTIDTTNMVVTASGCNQSTGSVTSVSVTPNAGNTSYTWTDSGGNTVGTGINLGNVPAGIYCLLVTDSNNCKTTVCGVNVNNAGAPSLTVTAAPNNICSGTTTTLTATGAPSYTWNPGSATTNTISVAPGVTMSYTVTGDSLGCTSQQVITVNVTATPTVSAVSSQTTICSTQSTTLTASGGTSYTWSTGGANSTEVVNPTSNTTYTVIGMNGNCSDTTTVNVNVTPTPTISISASGAAVCAGQTATLTASGATNYTWQPGGATTGTITDTPTGTTTYTVTGDNAGCTNTQQVTVTVNPLPTLSAVGNQTVCSGNLVNAINYTTSGGATVNWTNTNSSVGIGTSGSGDINGYTAPNVTSQETGVITATPTDPSSGCQGMAQSYTVIINPTPQATGGAVDSALCGAANGGVTGINVSGGTPGYTYQWYDNGVIMTGETNPTLGNVATGTYSVLITDTNGCTVAASATSFTINGSPAVVASITPPLSQGPGPLTVTFSNGTSGATVYGWNFGNGQTSTQQTPGAVTYNTPGTYTVFLLASNGGCLDTASALVIIDTPVLITVPNIFSPNGDGINDGWFITTIGIRDLHVDIFNRWGQLVYQLLAPNDVWNGIMNNGNNASEGTYYYIMDATGYDGKTYKSHGSLTLVK